MYCREIKVSRGTVFNELKRGSVDGIYDPEYAVKRHGKKEWKVEIKQY